LSFTDWSEEPTVSERIIGFCGKNDWSHSLCGVMEFGIITALKNIELPMKVYELPELQNTDGGLGSEFVGETTIEEVTRADCETRSEA
jgi:hypothetical protein